MDSKRNGSLYKAMITFQSLLEPGPGHSAFDIQEEATHAFPELVARSRLHLWSPGQDSVATGKRLLLGVATYSKLDMQLLDLFNGSLGTINGSPLHIDVFDILQCKSQA